MKIRLLVLTLMTVLSLSFTFSYRRIQNSNNLEGLQQCFRPVKQTNFHELRSRITATGTDPVNHCLFPFELSFARTYLLNMGDSTMSEDAESWLARRHSCICSLRLSVEIGDWTIHITHKSPNYNKEKIKSILIYSMTFPFKELEEFKDYLFED
ncbi:conserved Plasmodium protein, unknown function [Plasmodium ovale curtisi]|uniref:Uncharacterized protein n=1 Tax=Plasmodium ovale curtisi TaxID=864141 RepID=A0A1A8X0V6_PLAOA|nr:conserved Plasmodium protein, unknown function [Plasmodium ovale curtisi]SBS98235.1 conserved Plasmodium protein, unknown function [Plasmodium ovale curtisi]